MARKRRPDGPLKVLYLTLFNGVSCAGWSYILYLWLSFIVNKDIFREFPHADKFWGIVGEPLNIVQALALMEIVHVVLRISRSSLATTFPQVFSRVFLLWAITNQSEHCQKHWSVYLFVGSWACAEIPRYFFYVLRTFMDVKKVPWPIKFLRYSLFLVLYPTGISGELIQMVVRLPETAQTGWFYWFVFVIVGYAPIGPFLYKHMKSQRRRVLYPRPPRKEDGMLYPKDNDGNRSTMKVNHAVWCESVKGVDDELFEKMTKLGPRKWRFGYTKNAVKAVILSAKSKEKCLKMAEQGLEYVHNRMLFLRDGKEMPLREAMNNIDGTFETGYYEGEKRAEFLKQPPQREYTVPYGKKVLKNEDLKDKVTKWVKYGTIEKSCGDAILWCVNHPGKCDLRDQYFVLLGATSAMGPLKVLLSLGANVVGVDINFPNVWEKIFKLVKKSPGTLTFPTDGKVEMNMSQAFYKKCGCNLLTQTPEIANWLVDVYPEENLVIGGYAYLDGALFLKISVAMDAIMEKVLRLRGNERASIAFLCSPTDVFVIPNECYDAQKKNFRNSPYWQKLMLMMNKYVLHDVLWPKRNALKEFSFNNDGGERVSINNGLVVNQGPNYALSKRIQHWRCMIEKENGFCVSSNIAPSTRTASVVSNYRFEIGYSGLHLFKPMEVMDQNTSNAVMGALLLFDVFSPDSVSHPDTEINHPLDLFREGSFHGGIWRNGYQIEGCAMPSAFHFFFVRKWWWCLSALGGLAGLWVGTVALRKRWML